MYKKLFFLSIGIAIGILIGGFGVNMMLSPHVGDEYTIKRPKIRGNDNILQIQQDNIKSIDSKKLKFRQKWKDKRKRKLDFSKRE